MARELFYRSIDELESLFSKQRNDRVTLRKLQDELQHRKTARAAVLRGQVKAQLTGLSRTPATKKTEDKLSPEPPLMPNTPQLSPSKPPSEPNQAEGVLSVWTALEVLSPQAYKKPEDLAGGDIKRVATLTNSLPWERGEKSRPNFRLYYQVVLGSITLEPAIEKLIERYGDKRPERPSARGKAALAIVIVDSQGKLIASPSLGVSSFGWGVATALSGDLLTLSNWTTVESVLIKRLEQSLLGMPAEDEESKRREQPLTQANIRAAYQTLMAELKLPPDWLEPPEFAIRSYVSFQDRNPPEPLLLNSFFLADLALARRLVAEKHAPRNLLRYLGIIPPSSRTDLLSDQESLAEGVSPALTPFSRWPGPGRHPLALLQQAAVNLAFEETESGGLLGINGPPGTGKTTLLRDVVAGVISTRAEAMAKFDDPEQAFTHAGKIKAGAAWLHLYRLHESLRGFEMIVASSNNKAVENVSAELPSLQAIANDAHELRYFKTLSDALHQGETWGAIAAVLGNSQNRNAFKQTFWWDEDHGLNNYLRAIATETLQEIQVKDLKTGQMIQRLPLTIIQENPPLTRAEALKRWRTARQRFLAALTKSREAQTWLASLHHDLSRLPVLFRTEADATARYLSAKGRRPQLENALATVQQAKAEAGHRLLLANQALQTHQMVKPGFWARLFRTAAARQWIHQQATLHQQHQQAQAQHQQTATELQHIESELQQTVQVEQQAYAAQQTARTAFQQANTRLEQARKHYGVIPTDQAFFALPHNQRHQQTPWFPAAAQKVRDDLFSAAMDLHRAFIDAAAKPLRHNLGVLMKVFTTQTLPDEEKQALLPDLWTSLFLVVPLISTTFASVNRMLGKLPCGSLGWLLVDEAGQALPQATVGALLRTRRVLAVGDPMQIEPVVVLPETLTHAICKQFNVEADRFAAPAASVQTLMDAASNYACEFQTRSGSRSVGVPLLVHRRCAEPMFGISNAIAYSGLMVSAKNHKASPIRDVLGASVWLHVQGSGQDKWCEAEGIVALQLLQQLANARVTPDLYLITPFVIVADRLRQMVRESGVLRNWIDERQEWQWLYEHIGTVHTAQGREAEVVILILGAPQPMQTGARAWAGGRPNLLNVAVTRAKEALYVIGNRELWHEAGVFQELAIRLKDSVN